MLEECKEPTCEREEEDEQNSSIDDMEILDDED